MKCAGCRGKAADFKLVSITADEGGSKEQQRLTTSTANTTSSEPQVGVFENMLSMPDGSHSFAFGSMNESDFISNGGIRRLPRLRVLLVRRSMGRDAVASRIDNDAGSLLCDLWSVLFEIRDNWLLCAFGRCLGLGTHCSYVFSGPFMSSLPALTKEDENDDGAYHPIPLIHQSGGWTVKPSRRSKKLQSPATSTRTCSSIFRISDHSSASIILTVLIPLTWTWKTKTARMMLTAISPLSDDSRACSDSELRTPSSATAASSTTPSVSPSDPPAPASTPSAIKIICSTILALRI
ncbi:hypothetical protein BT96DRAFT_1007485 [Gymnopus androsaceus JB14]|uniref:Uncharacterized protein n=1 Tax=Gymnopus androsaceus JB14 TaxID=1447944 RepID=A0A6A4GH90_9AGAR|nr:hypothetical protein BT96DRAFT_1007485 [Gymnopus androsaceus JB14]